MAHPHPALAQAGLAALEARDELRIQFGLGGRVGDGPKPVFSQPSTNDGVPLWTNRYDWVADTWAEAVAVDRSGNVIVTGESPGSGGDSDFATVKYICVPEPLLTGLELTNGTFEMRVEDVFQPGTLVIEAATNLAGWAAIFTNTAPTNVLFYTDPDAGSFRRRFYRAFQFP